MDEVTVFYKKRDGIRDRNQEEVKEIYNANLDISLDS